MSKYKEKTDEELMRLLVKGDESAFNEIYFRYSKRILLFMYKMLRQDEARAQDFTQDVFLKIVEKAEQFDVSKNFKTWVFTLAANHCKNHFRSGAGDVRSEVHSGSTFTYNQGEKSLDKQWKKEALLQAILELDSPYRETFVLRYQENLRIKEIAKMQNVPEGTIKSRVHKAVSILSTKMRVYRTIEQ